jgi:hypothetical protein
MKEREREKENTFEERKECAGELFYLFLFLKIFSCMPQKLTKILSSHHHHHKSNTNSIVIMRAVNAPLTVSKPSTSNTPSQRRASSSLATTSALPPGFVAFGGLSVFLVGATKASQMRLEQRVGEEMEKCTKNGIDTSDLYYDFDLPGDAYPFGDAEGMDWVPDDWKPPKKGDPKFLPTRMLGQLTMRNQLYDVTIKAQEQGVDVSDVLIPFVDEDGNACDPKYDSNQKRYVEIRKRLGM